jgi:hypothetical protein
MYRSYLQGLSQPTLDSFSLLRLSLIPDIQVIDRCDMTLPMANTELHVREALLLSLDDSTKSLKQTKCLP